MYVYKKSDKNKEYPIELKDGIKHKSLWIQIQKIEEALIDIKDYNSMFEDEPEPTQRDLYSAIDNLKSFRHNLKLKNNMVCG